MRICSLLALMSWTALFVGSAGAQQPADSAGTRALYYKAIVQTEALKPMPKPAGASPSRAATARPIPSVAPKGNATAAPARVPNLGLKYTVLLVDPAGKRPAQPVDSDRNFRRGECFALEIEANRSGYLYVLAKQSSGTWQPMFPSDVMSGEDNIVGPNRKARIPAEYCFEVHDPPGAEQLFVILSRDPDELEKLNQGLRNQAAPQAAPAETDRPPVMQMASARLVNDEVSRFAQMGTRDLVIRKVEKPVDPRDRAYSVFAVNVSAQPTSRVVVELSIKHR